MLSSLVISVGLWWFIILAVWCPSTLVGGRADGLVGSNLAVCMSAGQYTCTRNHVHPSTSANTRNLVCTSTSATTREQLTSPQTMFSHSLA